MSGASTGRRSFLAKSPGATSVASRTRVLGSLRRLEHSKCESSRHWDGADVASSAQQVVIEEPTGIDAEAHEFRRRHEKEAGFAEQFIRRFPGTPYAGEYLIRRSPAAAPIAVSEQVTRIREGRSILGDRAHAPLVTAFVTRNPDHLLSPELRKVAFAAALVQGDRTTAQRLIGDMEQSGGEEVAVQEARLLLSRDSPEAC